LAESGRAGQQNYKKGEYPLDLKKPFHALPPCNISIGNSLLFATPGQNGSRHACWSPEVTHD
jgi:hypothetical protein